VIERDAVVEQLERILGSEIFRRSERSSALLRFVVERTLDGGADQLKEYTVGVEALGRGGSFDPRTDPVVRAEASRLRERLARYYDADGRSDPILLSLPKGSYVPRFEPRSTRDSAPAATSGTVHGVAEAARPPAGRPRRMIRRVGVGAVVVATLVLAIAWLGSRTPAPAVAPVARFEVELRTDATLGSEVGPDVALSADGARLVFVARDDEGRSALFTRRLDEPTVKRLAGTEGGRVPFLSPDGRWVGFWADGKLKRTPVDGGSPVVLCEATDVLGASWGEDGQIVAALNPTGKLWQIPENGGVPRVVVDLTPDSATPQWPQLLPGGRAVVYAALTRSGADRSTVEARALPTGERKVLIRGATFPQYLSNGYLTYVNQGTLYAVRFDPRRLEVRGPAVPVLEDVAYSRTFGYAHVGIARTGTLVHRRTTGGGLVDVAAVDRAGRSTPLTTTPGRYNWARVSPDGRRAAFTNVESGSTSLWVVDLREGTTRRVAGVSADQSGLTWWPDGRRLLLGGRTGMSWIDVERSDAPRSISTSATLQVPWSLAPGGRRLAYYELDPRTGLDLWTASVLASDTSIALGDPRPFARTGAFEVYPAFSPDGRWIAYSSNESGRYEIYVRSIADSGASTRVSTQGGRVPVWSPTASELLFQTDGQRVMAVRYRIDGSAFAAEAPRQWTPHELGDAGVLPSFDVASGGERIVALLPAGRAEDRQSKNHVTVVLNFHEEVRRRLMARGP
jgi:Tol biopolymer transport system component